MKTNCTCQLRQTSILVLSVAALAVFALASLPVKPVPAMAQAKGPQVKFDHLIYDAGFLDATAVIEHKFNFRNTGCAPLKIQNAQAGCGCTVPTYPKDPIPPNATGTINVRVTKKGDHWDGRVTIFSDDPDKPQTLIHAYGNQKGQFRIVPNDFEMLMVRNSADASLRHPTAEIKVQTVRTSDVAPNLQVTTVGIPNPANAPSLFFSYPEKPLPRLVNGTQPVWEIPILIKADANMAQNDYRTSVHVAGIEGASQTRFDRYIMCAVKVRNNCDVEPMQVFVANIPNTTPTVPYERQVTLKSLLGPFEILSATSTDAFVNLQVQEPGESKIHVVKVSVPVDHPPGQMNSKLVIRTNFPRDPEIVLPLNVWFR